MELIVNKSLTIYLFVFVTSIGFAQSKKKQILHLNQRIDSIQLVLNQERISNENQIKDLSFKKEQKDKKLKNTTLNLEVLQKELRSIKNELYESNFKLSLLNYEVLIKESELKQLLVESENW
jgi:hypothetical protein